MKFVYYCRGQQALQHVQEAATVVNRREAPATAGASLLYCCILQPMSRSIRKLFLSFLLFPAVLAPSIAGVQAQFSLTPTDSLVVSAPADSTVTILQIDAVNEAPDSVAFTWRSIESTFTEGWDVNLCDLGECYDGIPNSATMIPAAPGAHGYLKLLVNPLQISGHGFWHFWIYPEGNLDAKQDLYFDMDVLVVGVDQLEFAPRNVPDFVGHWAPNPARNEIRWIGVQDQNASVQLFDASGRLLATERLQSGSLNLEPFQTGTPQMLILVRSIETEPVDLTGAQRLLILPLTGL
jgi:hypothetical protein